MPTTRFRALFLPLLTLLLAVAPLSVASASPPDFTTIAVDFTFPIAGCEFAVQAQLTSTVIVSTWVDQDGEFRMGRERYLNDAQFVYTNLENGISLTSKTFGPNIFRPNPDGSLTVYISGLFSLVPGQGGPVIIDVGRIVVDPATGQILFSAGQFTVHGPGGSIEALCAALA
jgi:hypothetical protein